MDSFLNREIADAQLESRGKFTLNSRQAIEKMAKFQLPDKNYWILKLIQAAVRSGASGLTISLGVESSRILFSPAEEWTLAQMESDLLDPQPSPTPALHHFKQALWSAAFDQQFHFELKLPGASQELRFKDGQLERHACEPGRQLRLTVQHRPPTEMFQLIHEHAYTSPIPITLNQERVDDLASRDACFYYETMEQPDFPLKVNSSACKPNIQFALTPSQAESGVPLLISRNSSARPGQRHWVLDGVILQSQLLHIPESPLRCDLYISAAGLQRDATGTQLVEDEHWVVRRKQAGQQMAERIQSLKLVETAPRPSDKERAQKILTGVFAVTFFFNPVVVGAVALIAFGMLKAGAVASSPETPESVRHLAALKDLIKNFTP